MNARHGRQNIVVIALLFISIAVLLALVFAIPRQTPQARYSSDQPLYSTATSA